jgi:hypothetical protein
LSRRRVCARSPFLPFLPLLPLLPRPWPRRVWEGAVGHGVLLT